ncbi:MAG: hypothetical protein ACUVSX_16090 [Aggregatilineales bacterium]
MSASPSLAENVDRRLELVEGEIVEVVSSGYSPETAANLLAAIKLSAGEGTSWVA